MSEMRAVTTAEREKEQRYRGGGQRLDRKRKVEESAC
jgi:hypothetical protein